MRSDKRSTFDRSRRFYIAMKVQHPNDTEKLKANSVSRDGVMAGNISTPSVGSPVDVQDDREKATDTSHLPDLSAMDFEELWVMHQQITKILADRIVAEKQELENRLAKLNQMDVAGEEDASQGADDATSRRKYPKVHPKYFNPQSPSETWSGRGKQPRWLVAALKSGHRLDEFKIARTNGKKEE